MWYSRKGRDHFLQIKPCKCGWLRKQMYNRQFLSRDRGRNEVQDYSLLKLIIHGLVDYLLVTLKGSFYLTKICKIISKKRQCNLTILIRKWFLPISSLSCSTYELLFRKGTSCESIFTTQMTLQFGKLDLNFHQ